MDVLNFNRVQSGVPPATGIATDTALPGDDAAGIDFSALLALGMNSSPQDAPQPQAQEDVKAEPASVADAQGTLPSPELLIALPQMPGADALAGRMQTAPDASQAPTQASQATTAAQAAVSAAAGEKARAAVVADETANIAA